MASILVVDDSPSILSFVSSTLQQQGHHVSTAADGRAGYAQINARRFDVVITDLYMPEVDGLELIQRCRGAGLPSHVIAMSSAVEMPVDLLPAARILGAAQTLRKPFTAAQLLQAVADVCRDTRDFSHFTSP